MIHSKKVSLLTRPVLFVILLMSWSLPAQDESYDIDKFSAFKQGLVHYKLRNYSDAAEAWTRAAALLKDQGQDSQTLKLSALGYLFATIAYQESNSSRAYRSWGLAIQFFLEGRSHWNDEKKVLISQLEEVKKEIRAGNSANGPVTFGEGLLTLLDLDEYLSFTGFDAPRAGLKESSPEEQNNSPLPVARDYYARPPGTMQNDTTEARGRGYGKVFSEEPKEMQGQRAVIPRAKSETVKAEEALSAAIESLGPEPEKETEKTAPGYIPLGPSVYNTSTDKEATSSVQQPRGNIRAVRPAENDIDILKSEEQIDPVEIAEEDSSLKEQPTFNPGLRRRSIVVDSPAANNEGSKPTAGSIADRATPKNTRQDLMDVAETAPQIAVEDEDLLLEQNRSVQRVPPAAALSFTDEDMEIARTAWRYLLENRQNSTGLINAVNKYTFTTMWDVGSSIAGYVAAEQIGLINRAKFQKDLGLILETLSLIPLYKAEMPNREYNTRSGKMVDIRNRISNKGSGWSALDIGRLLIWLKIVETWYPDLASAVQKNIKRLSFERLAENDEMNGTMFNGRSENFWQEGRLGYEQYAAVGYSLWGVFLGAALDYADVDTVRIYGVDIPHDTRNSAYLVSDPFILAKIELGGIDTQFDELIELVYYVQKRRWEETGILTAVNEDAISFKPWFVYNNVFINGKPWACLSHSGVPYEKYKSLSTKAALGWSVLYQEEYAELLREEVVGLRHPRSGFYAGKYESGDTNESLNINTNAIILEIMLYKKRGGRPFLELDMDKLYTKLREEQGFQPGIRR